MAPQWAWPPPKLSERLLPAHGEGDKRANLRIPRQLRKTELHLLFATEPYRVILIQL